MTNARDYRISYQDVRLNTTNLSTAEQNITGQNITEQDSLVMRDRFGDINGNNNWLRCKHIIEYGWLWELAIVSVGAADQFMDPLISLVGSTFICLFLLHTVPVTFVDYFRADYPVTPPTIPERYQFYFVFLRENLFDSSQAVDVCNECGESGRGRPGRGK